MSRRDRLGWTVVIGQMRWGAGPSIDVAKANFRDRGGKLSNGYTVATFDATTEFKGVDEAGRVLYIGNAPEQKEVAPRKSAGKR